MTQTGTNQYNALLFTLINIFTLATNSYDKTKVKGLDKYMLSEYNHRLS